MEELKMKKIIYLLALVFSFNSFADNYISPDTAAQKAKNAVGGGKIEEVEFKQERGIAVFEVEIEKKDRDFEVTIDAKTGKVLKIKRE